MRVLPEAIRARTKVHVAPARARLSLRRRRRRLALLGLIFGALLGVLYARFQLTQGSLKATAVGLTYALAILGGSLAGYLLLAVPRAVYLLFRRYWWQAVLAQAGDRTLDLASKSQHLLTEEDVAGRDPIQVANDLAVIACLRRQFGAAAERLQQLPRLGPTERGNFLVALVETQRWPQAAALLESASDGDFAEANLAHAALLMPEGEALQRVKNLAAGNRPMPQVLNNLAVRALRAGNLTEARTLLRRALDQRSAYPHALVNLSLVAYRERNLEEALNEAVRASELAPGEALVCCNLGALLSESGDLDNAEQWLIRALNRAPLSGEVQINLGNCYALQLKLEEAMEAYRSASRHEDLAALADYNAAILELDCGEYDSAENRLKSALRRSPHDSEILNSLGYILWQRKSYAEAEETFQRAVDLDPSGMALGNLVCAKLASGHANEALELLAHAAYDPVDVAFDKGLAHLLAGLAIDRDAGTTQRKLFDHHLQNALAGFGAVIGMGYGPLGEAYINLALVEYINEHYEAAAKAFAEAAKRYPELPELNYYAGVSYLLGGMQKQAQRAAPGDPLTPLTLDYFRQGRPYLERAMESQAVGVAEEASYNLGVVSYLTGDYDKAITLLKKAAGPEAPPEVFNAVGIAQARQAQELHKSIAATGVQFTTEQRRRQVIAEINKLLSGAIHYFRLVLKAQPHSPLVHANIGLAHMLRNGPEDIETALHHWTLMRQVGGAWGQRAFELFSQAMYSEEAKRLRFQDIEMSFRPVPAREWIHFTPPRPAKRRYALQDFPDEPLWALEAYDPLVNRALRYRDRAERARAELRMLGA